jgi:hypothetical protein
MYYLQSRYYNPKVSRFLNADGLVATGQGLLGNNMYIYCLNNPVNSFDPTGNAALWYFLMADSDMGFIHRMLELFLLVYIWVLVLLTADLVEGDLQGFLQNQTT